MPLHTDLRPETLEDFVGNRTTIQALQSVLAKKSPPHSYLFTGSAGCGKTTLARITAKEIGCKGFDLKEQNAADFRGIDSIRDILRRMQLSSLSSSKRGWILDEAHKLTNEAQTALLKALEEPPKHVYFFLCTTDPQQLLKTVRSRCTVLEVNPLSPVQMTAMLSKAASAVGVEVPKEVLEQIGKDSQYHPREALTILEKVIELPANQMLRAAKQSSQVESQAIELARLLLRKGTEWKSVAKILSGLPDKDYEGVRRMVRAYCSTILLKSDDPQAYLVLSCFSKPFYNDGKAELVEACYEAVME